MYFLVFFNIVSNALNPQHLGALIAQHQKVHVQRSTIGVFSVLFYTLVIVVCCLFVIPCQHSPSFIIFDVV
jgi:hypothetical protein